MRRQGLVTAADLDLGRKACSTPVRGVPALAIDGLNLKQGGNRAEAAALLGLNRTTLVEKLRKLG